jgi:hypothetical protein
MNPDNRSVRTYLNLNYLGSGYVYQNKGDVGSVVDPTNCGWMNVVLGYEPIALLTEVSVLLP